MDQLAYFLQAVGYRSVVGYPYLPVYLHLLVSALFPIYAGAHASLSRPSSAAKPSKGTKRRDDPDDDSEEREQRMEGLGPMDALILPLFAGFLLASLYFIIKWLEDPALLNKILNWYFAIFGVWSLARTFRDGTGIFTSIVFPDIYDMDGNIWEIDAKRRKSKTASSPSVERKSPVPKPTAAPELPPKVTDAMWVLRELPSRQLDVRVYIHRIVQAQFKIGPQGITSLFLAIAALLYFNLIGKPWWLTNLLGFSLAYSTLQIMSPTTSWTGTLILGALFVYDIYFVFFTPLMVTVATQLDIPAKLVFPRPRRPTEDPAEKALFMLGLGDIILPGMMIGFALRFDLYLFYLRKQTRRTIKNSESIDDAASYTASNEADDSEVVKATWFPATSGRGERLWTRKAGILRSKRFKGIVFPKTYFRASVIGYLLAMICTLAVMDIYGQAQPALLYLVPGVLGSLWGTALVKGDIKTLWAFDESEDDQGDILPSKTDKQDSVWKKDSWMDVDWKSLFLSPITPDESENSRKPANDIDASDPVGKGYPKRVKRIISGDNSLKKSERSSSSHGGSSKSPSRDHEPPESECSSDDNREKCKAKRSFDRDRTSELVFLSINLPRAAPAISSETASMQEHATSSAHIGYRTRKKSKVEGRNDGGLGET